MAVARELSPFHRPGSGPDRASTRREFLWRAGGGLGGIALASMLAEGQAVGGVVHHPAKAKRVVQLFMSGAGEPYRPLRLQAGAGQAARPEGRTSARPSRRSRTASAPGSGRSGSSGSTASRAKMLGEVVSDLGRCVDEIAFVHNMVSKTGVHSAATLLQSTGFRHPGVPRRGGLGQLRAGKPEREPARRSSSCPTTGGSPPTDPRTGARASSPPNTRGPSSSPARPSPSPTCNPRPMATSRPSPRPPASP